MTAADKRLVTWIKRARTSSIFSMTTLGIIYIIVASDNNSFLMVRIAILISVGAGAGVLYAAEKVKRILLAKTSLDVKDFGITR